MSQETPDPSERKRGRRKMVDGGGTISAWISARHHEKFAALARRHGVSVSSLVRRVIVLALKDDSSGPM